MIRALTMLEFADWERRDDGSSRKMTAVHASIEE